MESRDTFEGSLIWGLRLITWGTMTWINGICAETSEELPTAEQCINSETTEKWRINNMLKTNKGKKILSSTTNPLWKFNSTKINKSHARLH